MEEYVNYVKISGMLDKINKTDSGSFFGRIVQTGSLLDRNIQHFYELYISEKAKDVQNILTAGKWVMIEGKLTVFRSRFGHKLVIDVMNMWLLDDQGSSISKNK